MLSNPMQTITLILASSMVPIALGIVSVQAIQQMIRLYQAQSLILALLTLLIAFELTGRETRVLLVLFALLIPGLLAYIIEPLLARATVTTSEEMPDPWLKRLAAPFFRAFSRQYRQEAAQSIRQAVPIWLEHNLSSSRQIISLVVSLALTTIAYVLAFGILKAEREQSPILQAPILSVSITLLMLGMFTMINRQDLISQVIGLLVMDHGLFLAVVGVINHLPSLIPAFVISLFLYILITLLILVILLPELHARSKTIEVAGQNELKG
jgi:hydrogenase-4 membrane subunit HyfE